MILMFAFFVLHILQAVHSFSPRSTVAHTVKRTLSMAHVVNFVKYQGLGNDFILVDNRQQEQPIVTPDQAVKLCDRHFGIGADGVIFALPGQNNCDYTMRIYNSDGSEPQMCGNGIRCLAKFLQSLEQRSGGVEYKVAADGGAVTVDMGTPILAGEKIPTTLAPTRGDQQVVDAPLDALSTRFAVTAVSMGNPHAIIFVEDLETMQPAFDVIGPTMERHPAFPQRVNAEFVQVLSPTHAKVRVWERGAGPTLACGTGACAVLVAGVLTGRLQRDATVSLPGGDLRVRWDAESNKLFMTGPAQISFSGAVTL